VSSIEQSGQSGLMAVSARSVSDSPTLPWNAKAQPSLDRDSASYGLASAKAAKRTINAAQKLQRRGRSEQDRPFQP
jgi:hypothetical protein